MFFIALFILFLILNSAHKNGSGMTFHPKLKGGKHMKIGQRWRAQFFLPFPILPTPPPPRIHPKRRRQSHLKYNRSIFKPKLILQFLVRMAQLGVELRDLFDNVAKKASRDDCFLSLAPFVNFPCSCEFVTLALFFVRSSFRTLSRVNDPDFC